MKSKKLDINNWSVKSLLIILFFLLISIVILWKFVLPNHKVEASWWNDGWNYRKAVSISNTGAAQTNTQIKILNNYDLSALVTAGKIQADLDDLRFTDINGNLLNYWIEDSTNNSVDIWGVVSSLPTSGTTIYMYYGNPSATSVSSTSNITIGGTMTSIGGYRIHTFTSNGTLTNANNTNAEVLVVAGGGGGGSSSGVGDGGSGGGGAGGLTYNSSYALTQGQIINITVGVGGTNGATSSHQSGTDGGNSIFGAITTNGGGGGGTTGVNGRPGGSGGGGGYNGYTTIRYGGSGVVGIGNSGGATTDLASASGAGGGGAGGVGGNNITGHVGGNGGLGINYSITGIGVTYASGGRGGGGAAPVNKTANTGNGGDGAYSTSIPTSGASGIVVVRFLSGTASTPSTEEAGGGPIAYWKFDEGTGTSAYNSTTSNHNGALQNGTSWASEDQCVSGKCLKFDGVNDYVSAGVGTDYLPMNTFSICAWAKSPGLASGMSLNGIISYTYGLTMSIDGSGHFLSRVDDGSNIVGVTESSQNLYDNKFHHLCFTFDGTNRYMYIDGKLKVTTATTWNNRYSSNSVNIGHENNNSPIYKFNGFIDEPKIYPYARTAAQIKLDYNSRGSSKGTSANLGSAASDNNLSDGLVGYWKMDENTGISITDSSGLGYTGIFGTGDSAPSWSSGKFGVGTSFDGSNDYIDAGNVLNMGTNDMTISTWIKTTNSSSTAQYIVSKSLAAAQNYRYGIFTRNGTAGIFMQGDGGADVVVYGTKNIADGNWHNITYIFNRDDKADIYVDGIYDVGQTISQWNGKNMVSINPFRIGAYTAADNTGITSSFSGFIDETRVYNRALSPTEVSQLYEFAPGPIFYWDFNEGIGTTAFDKQNHTNLPISNATYTSGKYGGGLNFNGNAWLEKSISPSIAAAQDYTQCLWFNTSTNATRQILIDDSNQWEHWIAINTNKTISGCYYNASQMCATSTNIINLNTWNYVCLAVQSGQKMSLFLNGSLWAENTNIGSTLPKIYDDVCIGKAGGGSNEKFTGKIDDVKIYNYARTQKQITEDMNANHPAVSSNSMIGYWKFDEGSGTTANNSGNGGSALNGTLTGTTIPTWTNDSKSGKAINLNGINSFARTGIIPASDAFSLSVWFKANQVRDQNRIYWGTGTDKAILAFSGTSGYLTWYMSASGGNTGYKTTSKKININDWNHVVLVYNGSIVKCFINGVEDNIIGTLTGTSVASAINLGTNYNNTGNWFDGKIDEVKAYNYALTSDEIKLDYNQGSALQMGQTSQTISGTTTSLEYCIPGDTSACASPVAEWNFEENTGTTTKDSSGNNNTGTFGTGSSAPTWTIGKKNTGAGLRFDGVNDYLTFPNYFNLSPATLEFWFKANSWSNSPLIIGKDSAGATNGYVQYVSSQLRFYAPGNTVTVNWGNPSLNTWHHATLVITGTQHLAYLDGALVGSPVSSALALFTGNYNFKVGCYDNGALAFNGSIDQMKIYNYARTPAQVAYDYNKGGPIGWWKLDECQGSVANDSSGIGNTGSINISASGTQTSVGTCTTSGTAWGNGASGKINSSLNFDGTDDEISIGSFGILNNYTISFWAKHNVSSKMPIGSRSGTTYYWYGDSSWKYTHGGTSGEFYYPKSVNIPNGTWGHFTVTYDGINVRIYRNGKFEGSQGSTGTADFSNGFYLGWGYPDSSYHFNGQIDDVRIYNYALTPEQVKTLYNGGAVSFN
ncbi:MAG: DUF2341 domain-containing protein [Candidatus Shapirobacteria bacterium]|jgi:hypothetical protein